ncbi:MAG: lipoyl domain-containing protein [Allomuricauda sp.]|jgi:pyruvate/2-oxoglutarate dehydrogenase complex dihydrolipoamide acyltransferase (E2) component
MAVSKEILLPNELGEDSESMVILWYKDPGDSFQEGETLVEIQTEKVAYEVPAPFSGTLREIKVNRGETAKVGDVIALAEQN